MIKWIFWVVVAAILVFGGWSAMTTNSPLWGRFFMSLGWLLSGFLLVYFAYKNLSEDKKS